MRQSSVSLTDATLDRIDVLRVLDGMPSRSAMMSELIDIGLAIRENPAAAVRDIIEAMEAFAGIKPATETAPDSDVWNGQPVNLREPSA